MEEMSRPEIFRKLADVGAEIEKKKQQLVVLVAKEKGLYASLQMTHPDDLKKPRKPRITKEKTLEIRRCVLACMKEFHKQNFTWAPLGLIVQRVNQELPNAEDSQVEAQVRWLAQHESSPIIHNGQRGNGSAYSYTGAPEDPEETKPPTTRIYT
jgi:hypothetical protein